MAVYEINGAQYEIGDDVQGQQLQEALLHLSGKSADRKQVFDSMIDEMGPLEKLAVGLGRAFVGTGQGIKQIAVNAGESLGLVEPGASEKLRQQYADEAALYKELTDRSGLATAGEISGNLAIAAPLMAIPGGRSLGARMLIGSAIGAGESMLSPVTAKGNFVEEKAKQAGVGGAIGELFPLGGAIVTGEPARGLLSRIYNGAMQKPAAQEGRELSEELGGLLTPGQETGSKALTILENAARQSLFTADQIFEHDKKVMQAGRKRVEQFISGISRGEKSPEGFGQAIQDAVRKGVSDLVRTRDAQAAKDYGVVRELAKTQTKPTTNAYGAASTVEQPLIKFDNVVSELDAIINQYKDVASRDASKVVAQAKFIKSKLAQAPGKVDVTYREALPVKSGYGPQSVATSYSVAKSTPPADPRVKTGVGRVTPVRQGEIPPEIPEFGTVSQTLPAASRFPLPELNALGLPLRSPRASGYAGLSGSDAQSRVVSTQVPAVGGGPVALDIDAAMKNRSAWSKASKGEGNIFKDVSPNLDRRIAARLAAAASRDFEQTAEGIASPQIKGALQRANANYATYSKSIEAVNKSALGRFVGDDVAEMALSGQSFNTVAGETVAKKFMALSPSETRTARNILEKANPEIIPDIKAFAIRDALEKALDVPPSQAAQGVSMSFNRFVKSLPDARKMTALGFDQKEQAEIRSITSAMLRAGDRTGYNASSTNVRQEAMSVASALGGLLSGSIKGVATIGGQAIGLKHIARAMTTPEGRDALAVLARPSRRQWQTERALALLASQAQAANSDE